MPVWQNLQVSVHPYLRGHAQRAAIRLRNVDAFNFFAIRKAQQPFLCAVRRLLMGGNLRPANDEMVCQRRAHGFGQTCHLVKVCGTAIIDPLPQLAQTESLDTMGRQHRPQLIPVQTDQVEARIGGAVMATIIEGDSPITWVTSDRIPCQLRLELPKRHSTNRYPSSQYRG